MNLIRRAVLAAAIVLAAVAPSASAQIFNFDDLKYGPPSSGFLPTNGFVCTGGDMCSSDLDNGFFGGDLEYTSGIFKVAVTGYYLGSQVTAMQDHENGYNGPRYDAGAVGAGLGVYHELGNTSDDNITLGEMIKLTFNQAVNIDFIGLRADGHNTTGWISGATYQYSTDGSTWTDGVLPANVGKVDFAPDLVSQTLYLRYGGSNPDQFYLSAASVTATPEPSSFALMVLGLGGLGVVARRLRRRPAQN